MGVALREWVAPSFFVRVGKMIVKEDIVRLVKILRKDINKTRRRKTELWHSQIHNSPHDVWECHYLEGRASALEEVEEYLRDLGTRSGGVNVGRPPNPKKEHVGVLKKHIIISKDDP